MTPQIRPFPLEHTCLCMDPNRPTRIYIHFRHKFIEMIYGQQIGSMMRCIFFILATVATNNQVVFALINWEFGGVVPPFPGQNSSQLHCTCPLGPARCFSAPACPCLLPFFFPFPCPLYLLLSPSPALPLPLSLHLHLHLPLPRAALTCIYSPHGTQHETKSNGACCHQHG